MMTTPSIKSNTRYVVGLADNLQDELVTEQKFVQFRTQQ